MTERFDIDATFRRLMLLRRRRRKTRLTFDEACDFIAAVSGQTVDAVRAQLIDRGYSV